MAFTAGGISRSDFAAGGVIQCVCKHMRPVQLHVVLRRVRRCCQQERTPERVTVASRISKNRTAATTAFGRECIAERGSSSGSGITLIYYSPRSREPVQPQLNTERGREHQRI